MSWACAHTLSPQGSRVWRQPIRTACPGFSNLVIKLQNRTSFNLVQKMIIYLFYFKSWNKVFIQFLIWKIYWKYCCCLVTKSCLSDFETPWIASCQVSLSFTISQSWCKLMSIESVMPSNHLILCFPLLLLPSIFPSIRIFSNELALCIRRLKYWSCSFSISPSNGCPGLISFIIDWFDLFAVHDSKEPSPATQWKH